MTMRDDFCAFILTHGRPDRVHTYNSLVRAGYTGKIYIVIDDEDETGSQYRARFGDSVLQFSKSEIAAQIDEGDNFGDRRAIIYARNACFNLAKQVGCRFFIQLDDDYTSFFYRAGRFGEPISMYIRKTADGIFSAIIDYLDKIPALSIALSQGGDWLGGGLKKDDLRRSMRKAMNTFVCCVDRPFAFFGRINEDVNTYTTLGRRGDLFFTIMQAMIVQAPTQSSEGGMTGLYVDSGTYVKSFYSVMYSPSCVKIGALGDYRSPHFRIHHKINWNRTVPKIISESFRKNHND